jgi:hypothetical protein
VIDWIGETLGLWVAGDGQVRGVTQTAPGKYHDEIILLVFIHTKYGEPIVIMDFRRTILCPVRAMAIAGPPRGVPV